MDNISCNKCGEIKSSDNFYIKNGYYNYKCKKCHKEGYNERVKNIPNKKSKVKVENNRIVCKVCNNEKLLCDFQMVGGSITIGLVRNVSMRKENLQSH